MNFGWPEILILLLIVLLLFGVGRIGKVGTELGQGLRNFRKAVTGEDKDTEKKSTEEKEKK